MTPNRVLLGVDDNTHHYANKRLAYQSAKEIVVGNPVEAGIAKRASRLARRFVR
jgi:hypothetical protein